MYSVCIAKSRWFLRFECSVHASDGFQNKKFGWGVDGWGELYPSFFLIFGIFLTLQSKIEEGPLSMRHCRCVLDMRIEK